MKPSRRRLTCQAIRVIEAAYDDASEGPIDLTPAIRLALGWLLLDGHVERWQADSFIQALRLPRQPEEGMREYMRTRDIWTFVMLCKRRLDERDREAEQTGRV